MAASPQGGMGDGLSAISYQLSTLSHPDRPPTPDLRLVLPSCRLTDFSQERQRPALVRIETGVPLVAAIEEAKLATLIAEEDGGVDIRGSADSARVAEARGYGID